jgi:hypothetical protein
MTNFNFGPAAAILFALFAIAASADSHSSTDDREAFAATVSKSTGGDHAPMRTLSTKRSKSSKREDKKQDGSKGMRRFSMPVRTTLTGVDVDDYMTAEECIFVEDTWMEAFQTVHGTDEDSLTARAFIVEQDDGKKKNQKDRKLRGDYSLKSNNNNSNNHRSLFTWSFTPGSWFDIWAVFEPSCNLCGHDDDRRLTAVDSDVNRRFELLFCDMLRQGPFERFQYVQECQVSFA